MGGPTIFNREPKTPRRVAEPDTSAGFAWELSRADARPFSLYQSSVSSLGYNTSRLDGCEIFHSNWTSFSAEFCPARHL